MSAWRSIRSRRTWSFTGRRSARVEAIRMSRNARAERSGSTAYTTCIAVPISRGMGQRHGWPRFSQASVKEIYWRLRRGCVELHRFGRFGGSPVGSAQGSNYELIRRLRGIERGANAFPGVFPAERCLFAFRRPAQSAALRLAGRENGGILD